MEIRRSKNDIIIEPKIKLKEEKNRESSLLKKALEISINMKPFEDSNSS